MTNRKPDTFWAITTLHRDCRPIVLAYEPKSEKTTRNLWVSTPWTDRFLVVRLSRPIIERSTA